MAKKRYKLLKKSNKSETGIFSNVDDMIIAKAVSKIGFKWNQIS